MRGALSASLAMISPIMNAPEAKLPELPLGNWEHQAGNVTGVFVDPAMATLQVYRTSSLNEEERSRLMYKSGAIGSINFSFFDRSTLEPVGTIVGKHPDGSPYIRLEAAGTKKRKEILDTRYSIGISRDGTIKVGLRPEFIKTPGDRKSLQDNYISYGEGFLGYPLNHPKAEEAIKNRDYARIRSQVNFWNTGTVNGKSAYDGVNGSGKIDRSFVVTGTQDGRQVTAIAIVRGSTLARSIYSLTEMLAENGVTGDKVIIADGGGSSSLLKPGFHNHTDGRRLATMLVIEAKRPQ